MYFPYFRSMQVCLIRKRLLSLKFLPDTRRKPRKCQTPPPHIGKRGWHDKSEVAPSFLFLGRSGFRCILYRRLFRRRFFGRRNLHQNFDRAARFFNGRDRAF
jgi:hypothetical protein